MQPLSGGHNTILDAPFGSSKTVTPQKLPGHAYLPYLNAKLSHERKKAWVVCVRIALEAAKPAVCRLTVNCFVSVIVRFICKEKKIVSKIVPSL